MDINLTIQLADDMDKVREIITLPDIWDRAAEDGVNKEGFYPVQDPFTVWLLCLEDAEIIGIILVHVDNSVSLKIHPYLKSEHREKGRKMMKAFYQWFLSETDDKFGKINVTVPEFHKKVINFAKKVGFKKEGFNRDSYLKDGKLYGQQNLGITRNEIRGYLDECNR